MSLAIPPWVSEYWRKAGLATATAVALTTALPEISQNRAEAQSIHFNHTNISPLSSPIIRHPAFQQASPFPYYTNPFTNVYSGQYFGNYFGGFGYGYYPFYYNQFFSRPNNSLYYYNNNSRAGNQQQQVQSRSNRRQSNCCCQITEERAIPESRGLVECRLKYPVALTAEQKANLESLYKDTVKSLVMNGYSSSKPEQLMDYLTPIMFAHDLYSQETLASIEQGFQTGSPEVKKQLIETYGSLEFFRDAMGVIAYHKDRQVKLAAEVTDEVLSRDREMVVKELNKRAKEANVTLDHVEERADFIVQTYNRLGADGAKLSRIIDGLLKYLSPDPEIRATITMEQRLYIEQLRFGPNEKRNVIGPSTLLLLLINLNDSHSTDPDGKELRLKIQTNIETEAAKSRKQLTSDISPNSNIKDELYAMSNLELFNSDVPVRLERGPLTAIHAAV